jgi:hypothetical protein
MQQALRRTHAAQWTLYRLAKLETTMTKPTVEQAKEQAKELQSRLQSDKELRDRWTGVFIGVIAMFMAVCTMLGNNATKDANRFNIEANNSWNFFQAKNLRRQVVRMQIDQLELELLAAPGMPEAARTAYRKKIDDYKALDIVLTSDKAKQEGLDELFAKSKALEVERDLAFRKDPFFDWAQTCLQIAIVLASVCLITGTLWLVYVSAALGLIGVVLMTWGSLLS